MIEFAFYFILFISPEVVFPPSTTLKGFAPRPISDGSSRQAAARQFIHYVRPNPYAKDQGKRQHHRQIRTQPEGVAEAPERGLDSGQELSLENIQPGPGDHKIEGVDPGLVEDY